MRQHRIIQGGMGVAVSGWRLANAVARQGQLGVVSGTGLAVLLVRKLQDGDPTGDLRRALAAFPLPGVADTMLERYFIAGGKPIDQPYKLSPMPSVRSRQHDDQLIAAANFVEVFLAKEGHDGQVGINFLEKIQFPTLPSLYGAMLAGVDAVLMGAGIPRFIPGMLDLLADGQPAMLRMDVEGNDDGEPVYFQFDTPAFCKGDPPKLKRPLFYAIVASTTLAMTMVKKSNGRVDGFIIEGETAGGHNAPPRGQTQYNQIGEPVYGERDIVDLQKIAKLGLPFWLAGSFASPGKLAQALADGAAGIQVGTAFAFCDESGILPELKKQVIEASVAGELSVYTDPVASPTGFPFKVVQLDQTMSHPEVYQGRTRICDLGYLRKPYRKEDGTIGYRCPAEPVKDYIAKGGDEEDTVGRKCICNSLFGTIGLGQTQKTGDIEKPIVTAGNDAVHLSKLLDPGQTSYTAADVIDYLLIGSSQNLTAVTRSNSETN